MVLAELIPPRRKRFNVAGPCDPRFHYMLPPLPRVPDAGTHVEDGDYFVLHAPRQSGKTTFLRAFAADLTASGRFAALYMSCEAGEAAADDHIVAQEAIIRRLVARGSADLPPELQPPPLPEELTSATLFADLLASWCSRCPRPVVLLLDEIDAVRGKSLIAILRQLRDAFPERPTRAPWSVVLCGLRDVREYKTASGGDAGRFGTASPFNIKIASFTLAAFTPDEVAEILGQHTSETGQAFAPEAMARISELTGGQPWLVNALAREIVEPMAVTSTITPEHVDLAKERLIEARATHLDSLLARLAEPRVRRVLEPVLSGEATPLDTVFDDDVLDVRDLGLVTERPLRVANPIYAEIIARMLSNPVQQNILTDPRTFVRPDGRFDLSVLLREFAAFWIEQGEAMVDAVTYREAGAQLVLMAFLQRVVNGGGQVTREYGAATRRIDLLITWPWTDASGERQVQREALELKVWRDGRKDPLGDGLRQLDAYLDRLGLGEGVLVIFDRRTNAPPLEERVREESTTTPSGKTVRVLRA